MAPKLSIVTATYNRKDFIGRCIESVANQPYPHKEHIIVDGGSTDGAVEVIREYAARYPHIRWISEPDRGISDAFNKGLALMTGDAVAILGDDDYYQPDVFGIVADELEKYPDAGMVSGHVNVVRNDDRPLLIARAGYTGRRDLIKFWVHWCKGSFFPATATFIRKEVIDTVGGFELEDRYAMDYHHWLKITEKFSPRIIDRVISNARWDEGSVSFSGRRKQWKEQLGISRKYWGSKLSPDYYEMLFSYWTEYFVPKVVKALKGRKYLIEQRVKNRFGTAS
jgi:glycosyltransferase involved in cell wall biosynthesis